MGKALRMTFCNFQIENISRWPKCAMNFFENTLNCVLLF
uniref:Uncharacterized protein n=1 Tax=Arundo donax TaxID=35708 RepID=A0A0A9FGW6_ARUDO